MGRPVYEKSWENINAHCSPPFSSRDHYLLYTFDSLTSLPQQPFCGKKKFMPSHSLLRRLSLLLIIHYTVAVPADLNYLALNSNGNTAVSPSLSSSGDGSTLDPVVPSQGGPVDASSDSQWQQGLDSLSSDDKESSESLIAGKKNGCQASADQDSLSKRDHDLCTVNSATTTPTKLQEAGSSNAKKSNGAPEQQRRPLPKPQPVDLPENYQVCETPGLNVPVCAPDSFAIGEPISNLMACSLRT